MSALLGAHQSIVSKKSALILTSGINKPVCRNRWASK
jgi:hypothetical protein